MIDSITIFSTSKSFIRRVKDVNFSNICKRAYLTSPFHICLEQITTAGIILYHYTITTKSNHIDNDRINNINQIISLHLTYPTEKIIELKTTSPPLLAEWYSNSTGDEMVMVTYPKVVANHADTSWLEYYMREILDEFNLFQSKAKENNATLFNPVQEAIYEKSQTLGKQQKNNVKVSHKEQTRTNRKGKENRVWHDREQKVTSKTMASLDFSKETDNKDGFADLTIALKEARAAYLPDDNEISAWEEDEKMKLSDDENGDETSGWGSSLKGMLGQVSGKVLTDADLERPLKDMEKMLTSKNVATEIAEEICNRVRIKLVGKKMASFTRVKTAVRQALEDAIEKILKPGKGRGGSDDVDVLRDVIAKREKGNGFLRGKTEKPKPFVIVMGKFIQYIL